MDFEIDEEAKDVAALAGEILGREHDADAAWTALAKAGLLTLPVPERLGGAGLGVFEVGVLLTEVGRSGLDIAALETLALGVLPIARLGTEAQRTELLGVVTDSAEVLTAALHEPSAPLPSRPRSRATRDGDGWRVSGTLVGVRRAREAYRVLVPATLDGVGAGVLLVDPRAAGVTLTDTVNSARTPEATVRLADVKADGLLGEDTTGATVTELHRFALVGACAIADGVLAGALDLTATHLGEREQFGRPLATFQAVAQQVADVYLASRTLHLASLAASWQLDPYDVEVAAYWLTEQVLPALHTCHHLHGGVGVDMSYPLHRHYSQAKDLVRFVGGAAHRLEELACSSN
ncbi:acyl-CoA dehydrogenase family protein [Pseudonocardia spinosispora]|uniref:acyl-CoA dehydrogenase family protein n=1 Tax=Pseudonocardia spinosispora TaxID=103441 RepID=UPI0003F6EDFF|nr:acyl-CoA dehydrogenase family protein [Pseudonocardia spinosispora]